MVAFSDITLFLTHVNKNTHQALAQPVAALKVRSGHVTYSPTASVKSDVEQRMLKLSSPMTIAPLIRAFRAQLALTAPELVLRKWTMFCAFEGTRIGGPCGKRSIPMFQIRLPSEITSVTPQMTPAPTQEYDHDDEGSSTTHTSSKNGVLSDTDAPQTLEALLAPHMPKAELELFTWSARFSFVVGEDEEEERRRREEIKAMAVTFSANKSANAGVEFTARDELVLEARLSNYPPAMREQMRNSVRQEIIDEKNPNRLFGAPTLPPQFGGGGLFGGGGFGFTPDNGSSTGLFGQAVPSGIALPFGSGGGSSFLKKAAVPVAVPKYAAERKQTATKVGGLFSTLQQQQQQQTAATGGWSFGAPLQQSSNAFNFSPSTDAGFGNLNF